MFKDIIFFYYNKPRLYMPLLKEIMLRVINKLPIKGLIDNNTTVRKKIIETGKSLGQINIEGNDLLKGPDFNYEIRGKAIDVDEVTIHLASVKANLTSSDLFLKNYKDIEDLFAANRFIWLFEILVDYPHNEVLNVSLQKIISWIELNNNNKNVFESYSISERIISWLFFIQFIKGKLVIPPQYLKIIAKSISEQLHILLNNLEYRGKETNNHILNNARALYISGRILNTEDVSSIGKAIIYSELPNIIQNGTNIEGSSHYQLLLTKNLIETQIIAYYSDDEEFFLYIKQIVQEMLLICNDILSEFSLNNMPLFGDISPDLPPQWLIGFPFKKDSDKKSKWFLLYENNFLFDLKQNFIWHKKQDLPLKKHIWYHLHYKNWEIWVNFRDNSYIPCHGHNDNGTIVIFYNGKPVVVDLGLENYINKKFSLQYNGMAHNIPILDNAFIDTDVPIVVKNRFFPHSKSELIEYDKVKIKYKLTNFDGSYNIIRDISIQEKQIKIIDIIKINKKDVLVKQLWHFYPMLKELNNNTFYSNNFNVNINSNIELKSKLINQYRYSDRYGKSIKINSIMLTKKVPVDTIQNSFEIRRK